MVKDEPDLIIFLGDYIYEYASPKIMPAHFVRSHTLRKAVTLADYRDRYALHKSDHDLQAAHAACPWLMTWDDHEVQNDYASGQSEGLTPTADFWVQRAAAYQAFYEHMPLPVSSLARGLGGLGGIAPGDGVRVAQRLPWGQLASFHVLDCRQFRDHQVCPQPNRGGSNMVNPSSCTELQDPNRSLLGRAQESWLTEGLNLDAKRGQSQAIPWTILAQSTLLSSIQAPSNKEQRIWTDGWDGYPVAKQRLLASLKARPELHPVAIGGDVHLSVVASLDNTLSEFCGTSISSQTNWHPQRQPSFYSDNPQVKLLHSERRGYTLATVTPKLWTTTLMGVSDTRQPDSPTLPIAKYALERGNVVPQVL
jgi:alkaline phosphatase D